MSLDRLLKVLSDGDFHSGEEIGALLGVSRVAVWKKLNKVTSLGLSVESIKGKGYRIPGGIDLLDKEFITSQISPANLPHLSDFRIFHQIESTNDYLMDVAAKGNCHGHICLAESQTAGRGRRGRLWHTPFAGSICLSMGWEFDSGVSMVEGLSLAVGVALVSALSQCGIDGLKLKWPNDIYFDDEKLGGVLIEVSGDLSGLCKVIIGIGINVAVPVETAVKIDQDWTELSAISEKRLSRNSITARIIEELLLLLSTYKQNTFSAYRAKWELLDVYRDREVLLSIGEQTVCGCAEGVSDRGELRLKTSDGVEYFCGGEVSLRVRK